MRIMNEPYEDWDKEEILKNIEELIAIHGVTMITWTVIL